MNTRYFALGSVLVSSVLLLSACQQQAAPVAQSTRQTSTFKALAITTLTNSTPLAVPVSGTRGPASLYPSDITVAGMTGTIEKVTVTISGYSHTFPHDVSMLLVGPSGETVVLAGYAGDHQDVNNISLTFDDAAAQVVPHEEFLSGGTYRPFDHHPGESFQAPAPSQPYGSTLGTFNGLNPNGTWKLYVQDFVNADMGSIAGGWSLNITTTDAAPPTIDITTPTDGAQYQLNQAVNADYSCSDDTAVASCDGPVADGAAIDTSTVGTHQFTVNATDTDNDTATLTHNYTVVYPFTGFFQPVDNPGSGPSPVFNRAKAGSSIPVKFSLGGDRGLNILAGTPVSKRLACDGSGPQDQVEETVTAGNSSLKYDAATGTYTYVWKSDKSWANTCRILNVELNDTTTHVAYFNFTK